MLSERLKEGGFSLVNDGLKLLWNPDQQGLADCVAFGAELARICNIR
jgi:flavorubredoxin